MAINKTLPPAEDKRDYPPASESGRRIRWERDSENPEQIVVSDAVTGKVIAIVRSLFEMVLK